MARGDYADAERRTRALLAGAGPDVESRTAPLQMLSLLMVMSGRLAEADRAMQAYLEIEARDGTPGDYLAGAILMGFIDIEYRRAPARGVRIIDDALARYPLSAIPALDRHYAFLAYTYALAGLGERSRALLAEYRAANATAAGGLRDEGSVLRAQGENELLEKRYAAAAVTLSRAATARSVYSCPVCALPDLARAYALAGDADSAIAVYQRYLTTPWSDWMYADGEFRVPSYRSLGELHEARGDTSRAIAAYRQFAVLWDHADPELQPQVAEVRARLARLGATDHP